MLEKKLLAGISPLHYGDSSAVCYIGAAQRKRSARRSDRKSCLP